MTENTIAVVVGHQAWNDLSLIGQTLEQAGISLMATVSNATDLADQARSLGADCVMFNPTLPGMNPGLVQELLLDPDRPIAGVGLVPAGSSYASEYQRFGMKGFVTVPLDTVQVQRLPDLVRSAVQMAQDERESRSFSPVTAEDALAILDRGGWQQQTIAVYSPKGGVGKSTIATNLAVAFGVLAQRTTLLIDADMSRANLHVLLGMDIESEPRNLFTLYERVIAEGNRTGRYLVRAQTLQANVRQWRGKLHVLPGIPKMHMAGLPEFVEDPERTMEIFADVVREARGYYEFRVMDVGPDFNLSIHWSAIQNADLVLLVITPELTSIYDIRNILPALERTFGTLQKFRLVLNGFDEQFGISPKEVLKYLDGKLTIVGTLPYAPTAARMAINTGTPMVLKKKMAPIGEALLRLGANFYPPLESLGKKRQKAKGTGLLGKIGQVFAEA
ncbi:MAG: AAA family ATPase [Anaerolineae bacterium]